MQNETQTKSTYDGAVAAFSSMNPAGFGTALSPEQLAKQAGIMAGHSAEFIDALILKDGLAERIIDLPIQTALSRWIECSGELSDELKRLNFPLISYEAAFVSRLYGGALVIAYCDDGNNDLSTPLNETQLNKVTDLKIHDRFEVTVCPTDYNDDPSSANYAQPEFYTVQPHHFMAYKMVSLRVHHSRCFALQGSFSTSRQRIRNQGWANSCLSPVIVALNQFNFSTSALPTIIKDFIQTVIKLQDLNVMMEDDEGTERLNGKIKVLNYIRSVLNLIALGEGDEYEKKASSVAGLDKLIDRLMMSVSATTGIPVTLLFGQAPQGMNATGEGDANIWHEKVGAYQERGLGPLFEWVIKLLFLQKEWKEKPDNDAWAWPDLSPIGEQDRAEIKLKHAKTYEVWSDLGVVDPRWLFEKLHQDGYQFDIDFDAQAYEEWLTEAQQRSPVLLEPKDEPTLANEGAPNETA